MKFLCIYLEVDRAESPLARLHLLHIALLTPIASSKKLNEATQGSNLALSIKYVGGGGGGGGGLSPGAPISPPM